VTRHPSLDTTSDSYAEVLHVNINIYFNSNSRNIVGTHDNKEESILQLYGIRLITNPSYRLLLLILD